MLGAGASKAHLSAPWILACAAFAWAALSPRAALARACASAAGCPQGYSCTGGACTPLPCQSDADCGSGMRCYIDIGTECTTAPDGGQSCAPASLCAPQWQVPCESDTDCGPGFTCSPSSASEYECGADQDAALPPYDTSATVSCAEVSEPPLLLCDNLDAGCPFSIPPICEAGSTCRKVTWDTCVAQQAQEPCAVDSDCPSTWTCQCQATCEDIEIPAFDAGASAADAACTLVCTPPNSDLAPEVCAGGAAVPPAPSAPSDAGGSADAGAPAPVAGEAPASAGSAGAQGGCQIGAGKATPGGAVFAFMALAWAARRGPKRRRRRGG